MVYKELLGHNMTVITKQTLDHSWEFHESKPRLKVMRQTDNPPPNLELGLYSHN